MLIFDYSKSNLYDEKLSSSDKMVCDVKFNEKARRQSAKWNGDNWYRWKRLLSENKIQLKMPKSPQNLLT